MHSHGQILFLTLPDKQNGGPEQRPNACTLSVTLYKRLEGKLNTLPSIKQNQNSAMSSSVFVYIESRLLVQPSLLVFLFACIQRQKKNLPVTVHPLLYARFTFKNLAHLEPQFPSFISERRYRGGGGGGRTRLRSYVTIT